MNLIDREREAWNILKERLLSYCYNVPQSDLCLTALEQSLFKNGALTAMKYCHEVLFKYHAALVLAMREQQGP